MENQREHNLTRRSVDLAPLLDATLDRCVPLEDRRRVQLQVHRHATAFIDPIAMERVLIGSVLHALLHTPVPGRVIVGHDARDDVAIVSVRGSGKPLTLENAAHVFDRYRDVTSVAREGRLSVRMLVCHEIVDRLRGRIASADPWHGSTFSFCVPMTTESPWRDERIRDGGPGARVLVVDDQPEALSTMVDYITEEGFDTRGATDGDEAMSLLTRWSPDIALVDFTLATKDGAEVVRRLRARLPGLPAAFITGYRADEPQVALARLTLGAGYLRKPLHPGEVRRLLWSTCGRT